jgi:hypothetical protein
MGLFTTLYLDTYYFNIIGSSFTLACIFHEILFKGNQSIHPCSLLFSHSENSPLLLYPLSHRPLHLTQTSIQIATHQDTSKNIVQYPKETSEHVLLAMQLSKASSIIRLAGGELMAVLPNTSTLIRANDFAPGI